MRRRIGYALGLLMVAALWAAAGSMSPAAQAQGGAAQPIASARSATSISQYGPSSGPAMPSGGQAAAPMAADQGDAFGLTPAGCSPLDSWCAYCASHADSDLCAAFKPAQLAPAAASAGGSSTAASSGATVSVQGGYLVGAKGMTLYTLSADTSGMSTCGADCVKVWPPLLLASGSPTGGSGVSGALATITRSDGGRQITYNGKPLYYFSGDAKAGDTKGDGISDTWGHWSAAKP